MKKLKLNNAKSKSLNTKNLKTIHKKELGYKIPENYFADSKKDILDEVNNSKVKLLYRKRIFALSVAATITLLISLTIFKPSVFTYFNTIPTIALDTIKQLKSKNTTMDNYFFNSNDISVAVLLVDDDKIDDYVNSYVLESVIEDTSIPN
jgi:CMP-N-acetylneuraminic acid synthetase